MSGFWGSRGKPCVSVNPETDSRSYPGGLSPYGQIPFFPYGKTFRALAYGQTPFSPYGNSSASDSVTQNRNRTRSGGTQYGKMTHWVPLEVPRRPIAVTESDAKSLKCRHSENRVDISVTMQICENRWRAKTKRPAVSEETYHEINPDAKSPETRQKVNYLRRIVSST